MAAVSVYAYVYAFFTILLTLGGQAHKQKNLPEPNAIIIGAPKAGTYALLRMLALHPEVDALAKEANYFVLDSKWRDGAESGRRWYRSRARLRKPDGNHKSVVLEKSPKYFPDSRVPERVHQFNSSVRLLLLVREPVARTVSNYIQRIELLRPSGDRCLRHYTGSKSEFESRTSLCSLEDSSFEAIMDRDWNETRPRSQSESTALRRSLLAGSMYAMNLKRWLRHFPLSQILLLDGEELRRDPAAVVRQTYEWLGLDPDLVPRSRFCFNERKGHWCWTKESGASCHGIDSRDQMRQVVCLGKKKGFRHPPVDPALVVKLRRYFAPHNEEFFELTGRTFNWDND